MCKNKRNTRTTRTEDCVYGPVKIKGVILFCATIGIVIMPVKCKSNGCNFEVLSWLVKLSGLAKSYRLEDYTKCTTY